MLETKQEIFHSSFIKWNWYHPTYGDLPLILPQSFFLSSPLILQRSQTFTNVPTTAEFQGQARASPHQRSQSSHCPTYPPNPLLKLCPNLPSLFLKSNACFCWLFHLCGFQGIPIFRNSFFLLIYKAIYVCDHRYLGVYINPDKTCL